MKLPDLTTARIKETLRPAKGEATTTQWLPYEFINDDGTMVQVETKAGTQERWLYMRLPSKQIVDANPDEILEHGGRLRRALSSLYLDPSESIANRIIVDADRKIHLLWLSWPDVPEVPDGASDALSSMLKQHLYPHLRYRRRCAYIGVQLVADVNMELGDAVKEVALRFFGKVEARDWSAYAEDENRVRHILHNEAGARKMSKAEANMLLNWTSRGSDPMPHLEVSERDVVVNGKYRIESSSLVTAPVVMTPAVDTWLADAVNMPEGVAPDAFSIKGALIDPASLIKRLSKAHKTAEENVSQTANSSSGVELEALGQARAAGDLRATYQLLREPALDRVQIVAARFLPLDREVKPRKPFSDYLNRRYEEMKWTPMYGRQDAALFAMMPCSDVKFPATLEHAVSLTQVAHMGMGDDPALGDDRGVVMGTDTTGRPVLLNHRAAGESDEWPTMIIPGASGAGKTMWAQWVAYQWRLQGVPGALINPKVGQPLTGIAELLEANVASLSGAASDPDGGALDFFSWAEPAQAATYAGDYLNTVLGGGSLGGLTVEDEQEIRLAMTRGADAGAQCVGDCIPLLQDARLQQRIFREHEASPLFRLAVGMSPNKTNLLDGAGGWTVVEMDMPLNQSGDGSLGARLGAATMGLVVTANYMNLVRRGGGVLIADEFHVMLNDGPSRERFMYINRNARSHGVLPILLSQFPSDFTTADGTSEWSPSRKFLLRQTEDRHIRDGLKFVGLSDEEFRHEMLKNANADRVTNRSPRGYLSDVKGRKGQVTLGPIPPWFIQAVSTNSIDIAARQSGRGSA